MVRSNYWQYSALASKIRGIFKVTEKPKSATIDGWEKWHTENKSNIGYKITEEFFPALQRIVYYPTDLWDSFRVYCKNRFITKTHVLQTKLEKGKWYDVDHRLLHGVMETVVNYVEEELGWMEWTWTQNGSKSEWKKFTKKQKYDLGMKRLEWESTLKVEHSPLFGDGDFGPTEQAFRAMELITIMNWWTVIRPNRQDPYSGSEYDLELESSYEQEDTDMLIRLMKIRRSLWT